MITEATILPVILELAVRSANKHIAKMTHEDFTALQRAVQALENPSLAARLTNMVGKRTHWTGDRRSMRN